jgi:pyruvate/2-oxoglutarate dehydrogenase complex dihydrolipoamide dehydrogenase (E3) component
MGLVYAGLGSQVTMVEFFPRLLPGADQDLVDVVVKSCERRFSRILTESKVVDIQRGRWVRRRGTRVSGPEFDQFSWPWASSNTDNWAWNAPPSAPNAASSR